MKIEYGGDLLLYPCPTVLVTSKDEIDNVFAVSWAGIASSHPEYVTIAINKKRLSYHMISRTKKFCINIPDADMIYEVDYCGSVTGREIDKFTKCGLKKSYYDSDFVLIDQCKFHLICNVETTIDLGSHDLFVAKVLHKLIDTTVVDIHLDADPIIYFRPNYYQINKNNLGYYGFSKSSVEKLLQ